MGWFKNWLDGIMKVEEKVETADEGYVWIKRPYSCKDIEEDGQLRKVTSDKKYDYYKMVICRTLMYNTYRVKK